MPAFLDFVHKNNSTSRENLVNDYLSRDELFVGVEGRPSKKQVMESIKEFAEKVKVGAGAVVWGVKGRDLDVGVTGGGALGVVVGGGGGGV